jgi:hypothetical protein
MCVVSGLACDVNAGYVKRWCVCVCVCVCVVQKSLEILGFRAEEVAFVCCSREFGDFWVSWCMCEVWRDDVTET